MRKIVSYLVVLIFLLTAATALEIREGEEVIIENEINENLYAAGGSISVDAPVNGDITAFGGSIDVNSPVKGHSMTCGGSISINAQVKDGVHACGGDVNINSNIVGDLLSGGGSINVNGDVRGDVRVMGGSVNINGKVSGDILALAGSININGPVKGDIAVTAGELNINNVVEGKVNVAAEKFKLGKDALIKGDLTHTSDTKVVLNEEQVEGDIIEIPSKKKISPYVTKITLKIFGAVLLLVISIILVLIMPSLSNRLTGNIKKDFWKTLLFGIVALVATPLAAILIAITIIGIPVTMILMLLYVLALYLSKIIAALWVGKLFFKKQKNLVKPMITGIIIYVVLVNIPYLGGLVKFLAILIGLGAITLVIFSKKKKSGKKR